MCDTRTSLRPQDGWVTSVCRLRLNKKSSSLWDGSQVGRERTGQRGTLVVSECKYSEDLSVLFTHVDWSGGPAVWTEHWNRVQYELLTVFPLTVSARPVLCARCRVSVRTEVVGDLGLPYPGYGPKHPSYTRPPAVDETRSCSPCRRYLPGFSVEFPCDTGWSLCAGTTPVDSLSSSPPSPSSLFVRRTRVEILPPSLPEGWHVPSGDRRNLLRVRCRRRWRPVFARRVR